jgi:hypothetical protein
MYGKKLQRRFLKENVGHGRPLFGTPKKLANFDEELFPPHLDPVCCSLNWYRFNPFADVAGRSSATKTFFKN